MFVEYKIRPVTRYAVTRYHNAPDGAGNEMCGEFENERLAENCLLGLVCRECPNEVTATFTEEGVKFAVRE